MMFFEIMMSLLCMLYDANVQYIPAHTVNSREIKKTYPNLVENWFSESLAEFIQLGVNSMWIVFGSSDISSDMTIMKSKQP